MARRSQTVWLGACCALLLSLCGGRDALAQFSPPVPPGGVPGNAASGRNPVCLRLESQLAMIDRGGAIDPGKAELKSDGAAALRQVAAVLRDIPDRDFLVAGHTDNRPIRASTYRSNWELSTARAVAVTRTLTGAGVPVGRIVAAGFGAEHPRVANTDDAARSKNRRIEVLLVPIRSVASR